MTSTQVLNCVLCSETFADKETLQEHFRKHGDPKFSSPKKGSDDTAKEKQSTDLVSCDVCTETFPTISKAITHKHKAHPDHDAKHFCSWCGKLFTLKFLYSKHMVTHESIKKNSDTVFPCDVCSVEFYIPSAMIYHNKFFHRQDAELLAIGHSKKQKFIEQELFPLYYCPFCGDENINKVNLHKHIEDDHSDENQSPDEVLKCPLCEAIFYHLDAYQIHLTFHSTEDVYSGQKVESDYHTEFSLETAPPIVEKVGDLDVDPNSEVMDLDQLLQAAMNDSQDSGKSKKKKKHKKTKKETITLDEFLNMNKDVFGEEVDVHGIEEVPSKIIAKHLKTTEKPQPPKKLKVITKPDMERFKQQGVIIKLKPTTKPKNICETISGFSVGKTLNVSKIARQSLQTASSSDTLMPSRDGIVSKLMNTQEITIMKKPTDIIGDTKHLDKPDLTIKPVTGNNFTQNDFNMSNTPESLEVDCDPFSKDSSQEEMEIEEKSSKIEKNGQQIDSDELSENSNIAVNDKREGSGITDNSNNADEDTHNNYLTSNEEQLEIKEPEKEITVLKSTHKIYIEKSESLPSAQPLDILKKLGITVKANSKSVAPIHSDDNLNWSKACNKQNKTKCDLSESTSIKEENYTDVSTQHIDSVVNSAKVTNLKENLNKIAHCLKNVPKTISVKAPNNQVMHSNSEHVENSVYDDENEDNDDGDDNFPSDFDVSDEENSEKTKDTGVVKNESKCLTINPHTSEKQHESEVNNDNQSEDEIRSNVVPQVGPKTMPMNIAKRLQNSGLIVKNTTPQISKKSYDTGLQPHELLSDDNQSEDEIKSNVMAQRGTKAMPMNIAKFLQTSGLTVKSPIQQVSNPKNDLTQNEIALNDDQSEDEILSNVMPQVTKAVPMNIAKKIQTSGLTVKSAKPPTSNINKDAESKECIQANTKPIDTLKHLQNLTVKPVQQVAIVSADLKHDIEPKTSTNLYANNKIKTATKYVHNRQVVNKVLYSNEGGLQKKSVCKQELNMESQYEQTTSENGMSDDFSDDDFVRLGSNIDNDEKNVRIKILNKLEQNTTDKMISQYPKMENKVQLKQIVKQISSKEETVTAVLGDCSVTNKSSLTGVLSNLSKSLTVKPLSSPTQKRLIDEPEVYNIDDSDSEETGNSVENKMFGESKLQKVPHGVHKVSQQPRLTKPLMALSVKHNSQPRNSPKHKLQNRQGDGEYEPNTKLNKTDPSTSNISKLINNKNISIKNNCNDSELLKKTTNNYKITSDDDGDGDSFGMSGEDNNFTDEDDEPLNAIKNEPTNRIPPRIKNDITLENFNDSESDDEHKMSEEENSNECLDTNQSILNKLNSNLNLSIKSNNRETSGSTVQAKHKESNISSKQLVKPNININKNNSEKRIVQHHTNQLQTAEKASSSSTVSQHVTKSVKTVQRQTIVEEVTTTVTRTIKTVNQEVSTSSSQQIINKAITGPRMPNIRPQMRPAVRAPTPAGPPGAAVRQPVRPRVANMNPMSSSSTPRMQTPVGPSRQVAIRQMRPVSRVNNTNTGNSWPQNQFPKVASNVQAALNKKMDAPARMWPESRGPAQASCSSEMRRVTQSCSETVQSSAGVTQLKSKFSSTQESSRVVRAAGAAGGGPAGRGAGGAAAALAAVQRLQAQGLLVKKPRIDFPEDEDAHNSGSEDEFFDNDLALDNCE